MFVKLKYILMKLQVQFPVSEEETIGNIELDISREDIKARAKQFKN